MRLLTPTSVLRSSFAQVVHQVSVSEAVRGSHVVTVLKVIIGLQTSVSHVEQCQSHGPSQ